MADYRLKMMLPAQRSKGRSAVAMAAYRSAERLTDERLGNVHDYERRVGVLFSEIVTPEHTPLPGWVDDRGTFWNKVEASETRKNSQVARELVLSLPHELSEEGRLEITLDFAQHVADRYGIGVDVNLHAPSIHGDQRNYHAHLMMTTRQLDADSETGFGAKVRTLDGISERQAKREGDEIKHLREVWRDYQNLALVREDVRDERGDLVQVDHRSYEEQGIDREGTEHEGYVATAIKRRGGHSELVAGNDNIRQRNAEREELTQQIEESREAIGDELQAIHRTPDEDKIKYKFHDDETVQEIFAEQEAERRGFATLGRGSFMGRGSLSPRLFRAGDSRRLAEFNAEDAADEGDETGKGDETGEGQRAMHSAAQRRVDQEETERAWQSYERATAPTVDETERVKWREAQQNVDQEEADRAWQSYQNSYEISGGDKQERIAWRAAQRQVDREDEDRALRSYENATRKDVPTIGPHDLLKQDLLRNDLPKQDLLNSDLPSARPWRWRGLDAFNREAHEPDEDEGKKERDGGSDRQFANSNELLDTDPREDEYERQRSLGPTIHR